MGSDTATNNLDDKRWIKIRLKQPNKQKETHFRVVAAWFLSQNPISTKRMPLNMALQRMDILVNHGMFFGLKQNSKEIKDTMPFSVMEDAASCAALAFMVCEDDRENGNGPYTGNDIKKKFEIAKSKGEDMPFYG